MTYLVYGVMYGARLFPNLGPPIPETVGIYYAGVMIEGKFIPRHEPIPEAESYAARFRRRPIRVQGSARSNQESIKTFS